MPKSFDLDLELKVTKPCEGQNMTFLTFFTFNGRKLRMTLENNKCKSTSISERTKLISQLPFSKRGKNTPKLKIGLAREMSETTTCKNILR